MTLRDLTLRQRDLLVRRCDKQLRYWKERPKSLQPIDSDNWFRTGFNESLKAVLDILLTPKKDAKGK
jgi:hypothetical protein